MLCRRLRSRLADQLVQAQARSTEPYQASDLPLLPIVAMTRGLASSSLTTGLRHLPFDVAAIDRVQLVSSEDLIRRQSPRGFAGGSYQ